MLTITQAGRATMVPVITVPVIMVPVMPQVTAVTCPVTGGEVINGGMDIKAAWASRLVRPTPPTTGPERCRKSKAS